MNYEEFCATAGKEPYEAVWQNWKKTDQQVPTKIKIEWALGGASGGDCYGGTARGWTSDETEPEFTELDEVFEKVVPDISFLQYKKICNEVMDSGERTDSSDYYGNYTDYAYKSVDLKQLYDALVKAGLLEGADDESGADSRPARKR